MSLVEETIPHSRAAELRPGDLRLHVTPTAKLYQLPAGDALARLRGIRADMPVPFKSFGPDHGDIHWTDGSGLIAKLDDVIVSVSRLPSSIPSFTSMEMSIEYHVTSVGARAPDPSRGESGSNQQTIYFRDASGRLVYVWSIGQWNAFRPDFALECRWNREYQRADWTDRFTADWFDAVASYEWSVGGSFFRC